MKNTKAIGIDIGGTKISMAIVKEGSINGETLTFKTPQIANEILNTIMQGIEKLNTNNDIQYIGIATAGAVNLENSKVIGSTGNLPQGYSDIDFKNIIEKKFNSKVFIENDANAAAFAEFKAGAAKGNMNTITVTLGTGIGGGIIINGQLLKGKSGAGGEIGHIPINIENIRKCTCGTYNCWESLASGNGYAKNAQELAKSNKFNFENSTLKNINPDELTSHQIIAGWKNNDEFCTKTHDYWINLVTIGLIALNNIFDPESIILSGGMAEFLDFKSLENNVNNQSIAKCTKIAPAKFKNNAGIIGSALLAIQ